MKTNLYFKMLAGAAVLGSMASCSNDDVVAPDKITSDMVSGYAKIAINMPSGMGTRVTSSESGGGY